VVDKRTVGPPNALKDPTATITVWRQPTNAISRWQTDEDLLRLETRCRVLDETQGADLPNVTFT
jgi:hypothetical protein